jgi:hypothetical protein
MAIYKYTNGKDTITEYNDGNHQDFEGTFDVEELFESLKESDEDFDESVWLEENGYELVPGNVDSKGTIRLNISEISDELYDALLQEFRLVAEANGIDMNHHHWVVEAHKEEA